MSCVLITIVIFEGAFTKLDNLVCLLEKKTARNNTSGCTATDSDREKAKGTDTSNEGTYSPLNAMCKLITFIADQLHFNSLNDPPPPTSLLDEIYLIYQTAHTPVTDSSQSFTHSYSFPPPTQSQNSQQLYLYTMPNLPPQTMHYAPYWLPSWYRWFASWTIPWIPPHSWAWPIFS